MTKIVKVLLLLTLASLVALPHAFARKLPVGAYIKTAKIESSEAEAKRDTSRYRNAEVMLDSLFMHYGPHAEALYYMGQIQVKFLESVSSLEEKQLYARKLAAYADSLHLCCENKDVKKKYRKDCDEYTTASDTLVAYQWRSFYNEGVGQLSKIEDMASLFREATDSADKAYYKERLDQLVDSSVTNLRMSLALDSTDFRAYVGIAQVYEREQKYAKANEEYTKGLNFVSSGEDSSRMELSASYNFYNDGDYVNAAKFMERYLTHSPSDIDNTVNLGVFYTNAGRFDDAAEAYRSVLALDSCHKDALVSVGQYFNGRARAANDSATAARDADNEAKADEWMAERTNRLDSSMIYFSKALECHPGDCDASREFGIIAYVTGKYTKAAEVYETIVTTCGPSIDDWTTLGDCYIFLQEWEKAIRPYQMVIEQDPENKEILERLVELHKETKKPDKAAEYQKQLDALN